MSIIQLIIKGPGPEATRKAYALGLSLQNIRPLSLGSVTAECDACYEPIVRSWFNAPTNMGQYGFPPGTLLWFGHEPSRAPKPR